MATDLPATSEVVVVGGGIIGVAIARLLARDGYEVLLVEKGPFGGAVSGASLACLSTHTTLRAELPALMRSCKLWAEASETLGDQFEYRRQGELRFILSESDIPFAKSWVAEERAHGVELELLDPSAVRCLEPLLTGPIVAATWSPGDATVNPFLALRALLSDAVAHGARAVSKTSVVGIVTRGNAVEAIATDRGPVSTSRVVIAAGPWTPRIAAMAGVTIPILPRQAQCLASTRQPDSINCVIGASRTGSGIDEGYTQIQQAASGQILFNTVIGGTNREEGAQDRTLEVSAHFVLRSIQTLLMLFPSLARIELMRSWVRFEAVSPDDRFIAGRTSVKGLSICAGDNGSGFCRALMLAELIRDNLEATKESIERGLYDPLRFSATS